MGTGRVGRQARVLSVPATAITPPIVSDISHARR
jgi:hypothetical protein